MPNGNRIPPHQRPSRPLIGGQVWSQHAHDVAARIYHADDRTPVADTRRPVGPMGRFDPHQPRNPPAVDLDGRTVVYLAEQVETTVCEAIGRQMRFPGLCPQWRLALLAPSGSMVVLQDFVAESPINLDAPEDLGDGPWDYRDTQEWARAVHDDVPGDEAVAGIRYWSRRHRAADGSRIGINRAVWETAPPLQLAPATSWSAPGGGELSLHDIWPRVLVALSPLGVYPDRIDTAACERCKR